MRKQQEADNIWSFFFEPAEPLDWIAGQSIRLEIPRMTWGVDERRFTIASAPSEGHIRITTRVGGSEFKQSLADLQPGDEINGHNIEGDFVWDKARGPRLFIAGGIGITPFRAMLAAAVYEGKPFNTTLIYSSKEEPAVFQAELDAWAREDPSFFVLYLPKRLVFDEHSSLAGSWLGSTVYVSGPEAMVDEVCTALSERDLPAGQLHTDRFTGYD